jgi:hypothetical protein
LASAKIIGLGAIDATISFFSTPPADRPRKMSGTLDHLGERAQRGLLRELDLVLVHQLGAALVDDAGQVGDPDVLARQAELHQQARQARAAAPAPEVTSLTSLMLLPETFSAFRRPAPTTIAVPCWSSWKTGSSCAQRSARST